MTQESNTPSFYQQFPPVRSSKLLGWKGIEAAQYLASPGQVSVPSGLSSHLLILYLGEPSLIVQTGSTLGSDTLADTFVRKGAHAFVSTERGLGGRWSMDVDALFFCQIRARERQGNRIQITPFRTHKREESSQAVLSALLHGKSYPWVRFSLPSFPHRLGPAGGSPYASP